MKTIMVMTNQYGEIVAELERDGGFFWRVPTRSMYKVATMLCEGDVFKVEEIEVEEAEHRLRWSDDY